MSVEVGYFRRWLTNFTTTDNESLTAVDFDSFSFTAPSDPRLPGGGAASSAFYNVTAAGFADAQQQHHVGEPLRWPSRRSTTAC